MARVVGQMLVAFFGVTWLPPMERWYSGLMPYEYLLPSQFLLAALMVKICVDFTRGRGYFVRPSRFLAVYWLGFGWTYLGVMLVRWPIQAWVRPDGPLIPIFFHWVLASYVIAVGLWHRRRVRR